MLAPVNRDIFKGSFLLIFLTWTTCSAQIIPLDSCFKTRTPGIPKWHLYHKLCKPIILGHRGNPLHFQENTLDGFKSVRRFGVNAFELDVFLTKDGELVLFHDRETSRTTGKNFKIQEMSCQEIKKLRYLKKIKYGTNTITYNRRRKIAFLEQVLRWAKGKKIMLLIEMKPPDIILDAAGVVNSKKTGEAVAKMVKRFKMHNQVMISSFNYYATLSAKRAFPKLVVGTFFASKGWSFPPQFFKAVNLQNEKLMPGMKECSKLLPPNNKTLDFLLLSGSLEKSLKASFKHIDFSIFNNPLYGGDMNKDTLKMLARNYGKNFVVGTGGYYDLHLSRQQNKELLPTYKKLIKHMKMIFTDDLTRTRKLILKTIKRKCYRHHHGHRNRSHSGRHYGDVVRQEHEIEAVQKG